MLRVFRHEEINAGEHDAAIGGGFARSLYLSPPNTDVFFFPSPHTNNVFSFPPTTNVQTDGDKSPRSSTARVISLFWMFMGLGAYGYVTGTISNVMSADMVQSIETWTDLAHSKKVVCSALSTSQHREFFDGTIYFPPATVDGFTVEKLNGFAACFDRLELPEDDPQHVDAILFDYRMAQNLIGSLNEDVATAKAADPGSLPSKAAARRKAAGRIRMRMCVCRRARLS